MNTVSLPVSRPSSAKGNCLLNLTNTRAQQRLFAHDQRGAVRPAMRNVGEHKCFAEAAARRWTAVRDKVSLDEPRPDRSNLPTSVLQTATQPIILRLSIEIGRLSDSGLVADLRNRHAVGVLHENERLLGV